MSSDQTGRASPGSEWMGPARLVIPGLTSRSYLLSLEKDFALSLCLQGDLGTFPPDDLQFFVFKLISCDEELLKFLPNRP